MLQVVGPVRCQRCKARPCERSGIAARKNCLVCRLELAHRSWVAQEEARHRAAMLKQGGPSWAERELLREVYGDRLYEDIRHRRVIRRSVTG